MILSSCTRQFLVAGIALIFTPFSVADLIVTYRPLLGGGTSVTTTGDFDLSSFSFTHDYTNPGSSEDFRVPDGLFDFDTRLNTSAAGHMDVYHQAGGVVVVGAATRHPTGTLPLTPLSGSGGIWVASNGFFEVSSDLTLNDDMANAFQLPGVRTYSQSLQELTGDPDSAFNVKFTYADGQSVTFMTAAAVPEPSSLLLGGLVMLALCGRRRRRFPVLNS